MSVFTARPALRWLVPVAAAVAVVGGGAALGTLAAAAEPSLPERSAAQLLVDLQTARLDGLSGTVVQRADLGLPQIPALAGAAGSEIGALVGGSNTLRVWYSGPDKARIALLNTLGETDLIRNGQDVWTWQSRDNTAQHFVLPEGTAMPGSGSPPQKLPVSPQEAAELALDAVEPTTEVTTGRNARVAGRDAYELVLAPRDKNSLVGQVRLAIDATEHLPLRVEVFPSDSVDPAFEVAFTQVSFERPGDERFRFNPPPGAKIEEKSAEEFDPGDKPEIAPGKPDTADKPDTDTTVVGEGWTSVFVTRTSDGTAAEGAEPGEKSEGKPEELALLGQLPKVSGEWGSGRVLKAKMFTVLLTDDGRLLAGLVSQERLFEVAGSPAAQLK
jgi:outer membrane lipoprotein-sorting protein